MVKLFGQQFQNTISFVIIQIQPLNTENTSVLDFSKQRMLELYYDFFDKFCEVSKFKVLEMDTDSLYLALAEENFIRLYPAR